MVDCYHVHLARRTAHLVYLALVHFLTPPRIPLELLRVHLPFGQETNLVGSARGLDFPAVQLSYNVHGVLYALVCPKLRLDVLIAQETHLGVQLLPVGAEYATVEGNRRKEGHGRRAERLRRPDGGCFGKKRTKNPHLWIN